jgi:cysteinyl-tRNA synthetase
MEHPLIIYNTLTRKKEPFAPLRAPHVGMYVCGPTAYGDAHLGHARPAITFDVLFRYLNHLGYKVRYVRNITDVGHLEHDADEGEDKIAKKARLEQVEPMEIVQYYLNRYRRAMEALNVLPPSIEPHASGHIIEQIRLTEEIMRNGYAYESQGSVYFDVPKYNKQHNYGKLSGRHIEELLNTTRELDGQNEKRHPADFALWKKAQPEHIMRWSSPWSDGFPGWHCECTAMGRKYLGYQFDIHGGGMDLIFPHHECEIAQAVASQGSEAVRYWMHNNMITVNGTKMGKSLGNFITLDEFFTGSHKLLTQAYNAMTIRFFILQAHYRSTVDFSNEALQASEKGLQRLLEAYGNLNQITPSSVSNTNITGLRAKCYEAMNDDLNTSVVISHLFDVTKTINNVIAGKNIISVEELKELKETFRLFLFDILGLKEEKGSSDNREVAYAKVVDMLLEQRMEAKVNKDWATSDKIRNELTALGFEIKDTKDGFEWKLNK